MKKFVFSFSAKHEDQPGALFLVLCTYLCHPEDIKCDTDGKQSKAGGGNPN